MSDNLNYEQLVAAALSATGCAGDMLPTAQSLGDLEIIKITLQGAQVFATLADAQATKDDTDWGKERFHEKSNTVRPIRPSVN